MKNRLRAIPLRHSLAWRIMLGFLMIALLSVIVALAGIFYTNQASSKLVQLLEQDQAVTRNVLQLERAAERQNSSVRAYLLKKDVQAEVELVQAIKDYESADIELGRLVTSLGLPPATYQSVRQHYDAFSQALNLVRSFSYNGSQTTSASVWEDTGEGSGPYMKEQLIKAIDDLLLAYRQNSQQRTDEARSQVLNVTLVAFALVTIAGVLAALLTTLTTRSITRPLRKLASVARAIKQGNLDVDLPIVRGDDEVANLTGAMVSMAENLRVSRYNLENSLKETRRRNLELSAVNRVAATTSQSLDLDAVLRESLDQLMQVSEMEQGSIFLMDADGQSLQMRVHKNQTEDYVRLFHRVALGEEITGDVARTGQVTMLENPTDDPRTIIPILKNDPNKKFYLGVPLRSKGRVVGVTNLSSRIVHKIEPQDLELFEAIGNQIGVAIDNARLYQQAQQVAALEERNRLARDLHDSVTQTLFSITLTAETVKAMLVRRPERVEAQVDRLQNLARAALAEMRSLIFQLRPAALQEQGLTAALDKHITALRYKEPFEIEFVVEGERRLSDEHEQVLYRIAQEAFNNISKHAGAQHVTVRLLIDELGASLFIQDDGQGFDAQTVLARPNRSSLGLTSMQERAELAGGTYRIESVVGAGATICVYLPLTVAPRPVGTGIK